MTDETTTEHAVVIVGSGPTGMMLAAELALAGIDAVIVERRTSQTRDGLRAGGLHSRTIEIFDQRGSPSDFLPRGRRRRSRGSPASFRHQRFSHPPSVRTRALADAYRTHPGELGGGAQGAGQS